MNTLVKWTVTDYHMMIEAGILKDRHVELLAGEIHEMAPETPPHTFYGGSMADFFRGCLGNRALVREAHPITLALFGTRTGYSTGTGTMVRLPLASSKS